MISIGIPCYRENANRLLKSLLLQEPEQWGYTEIVVYDDGSEHYATPTVHHPIISYHRSSSNSGDIGARKAIATICKNNWILFLDADMLPVNDDFLKVYAQQIRQQADLIYGGIAYQKVAIPNNQRLRYVYGLRHEVRTPKNQTELYQYFVSASFLVKKEVFLTLVADITSRDYGLDILINSLLQQHKIPVKFIENRAYHLGLEPNDVFYEKSMKGIENTVKNYKSKILTPDSRKVIIWYERLKKWKMLRVFQWVTSFFHVHMLKNTLGKKPNLLYFNILKLNYFISCYHNESTGRHTSL